jgi:hypothetical protein
VVFNSEGIDYWKNQTCNYLLSERRAILEVIQEAYVIPAMLDNAIQGEVQKYEKNYNALNLIITALDRNVYDRVSYLETTYEIWLKLCM